MFKPYAGIFREQFFHFILIEVVMADNLVNIHSGPDSQDFALIAPDILNFPAGNVKDRKIRKAGTGHYRVMMVERVGRKLPARRISAGKKHDVRVFVGKAAPNLWKVGVKTDERPRPAKIGIAHRCLGTGNGIKPAAVSGKFMPIGKYFFIPEKRPALAVKQHGGINRSGIRNFNDQWAQYVGIALPGEVFYRFQKGIIRAVGPGIDERLGEQHNIFVSLEIFFDGPQNRRFFPVIH